MAAPQPEQTVEQSFRASLDDTRVILKRLAPLCKSVNDMVELLDLAITNDSQLSILMDKVGPVALRK